MDTEDVIKLPASSSSGDGYDNIDLNRSTSEPVEAESMPSSSNVINENLNGEIQVIDMEIEEEENQTIFTSVQSTNLLASVETTEAVAVDEKLKCLSPTEHIENDDLQDGNRRPANLKRNGSPIISLVNDGSSISGIKRPRLVVDEQQASVHITYSSLPRDSKLKLEELLQKWSEWHTRHFSPTHDLNEEALESGEKTYFPALHVGADKRSAVSFWMDNQTRDPLSADFTPLDSGLVPLYDRGYSLGLTSTDGSDNLGRGINTVDSSRCFNCGSYNHSMKECPKPRDNTAVNNARKQHKSSRRNQNQSSRNPTRYYQDSPRGKYDGLKPGVLEPETRQLLGLVELDPPPWLNRMREIGYPPGYLDQEDADQPSGITIFGEEESKEETEDGEILEDPHNDLPDPPKKMSVEFPGINAPIPENADEGRWTDGRSRSDSSRNRSSHRHNNNHQSEPTSSKGNYYEQRWSSTPRDYRDDGPPGVEPGIYSRRYSAHASYSPNYERSVSDRGRSAFVHETSSNHNSPQHSDWDDDYRKYDGQSRHSRRR